MRLHLFGWFRCRRVLTERERYCERYCVSVSTLLVILVLGFKTCSLSRHLPSKMLPAFNTVSWGKLFSTLTFVSLILLPSYNLRLSVISIKRLSLMDRYSNWTASVLRLKGLRRAHITLKPLTMLLHGFALVPVHDLSMHKHSCNTWLASVCSVLLSPLWHGTGMKPG